MSANQKPIFLSHSFHDKDLAERLVNLLTNGCDVSRNDIFCSSLNGMNIKVGTTSFIQYLKEQLDAPKLVILLITESYLASSFCLAELGAAWRMGVPFFPLAVPPISRSEIGGVLELVQAGDITKPAYLDQLRDKIIELFKKQMSTDGWNDQKEIFLNGLDALIKGIKKPDLVKRVELETAQAQSKRLLDLITAKDVEIKNLKEEIVEMGKIRPLEEVKAVKRKFSSTQEEFDRLCAAASNALGKLKSATQAALFWELRGDSYRPTTEDDWSSVHEAEAVQEIIEGQINHDLRTVQKAEEAVRELKHYLQNLKDGDFLTDYEDENEFPADVGNQKFWHQELGHF